MTTKTYSIWFRDAHTPTRIYRSGGHFSDRALAAKVSTGTDGMLFLEGAYRNVYGGLVLPVNVNRAEAEQMNSELLGELLG